MNQLRKSVLVADDELYVQRILEFGLTLKGYLTILASNGTEAIESYRQNHPDAVVLDTVMPGTSGFDAARAIREYETAQGKKPVPIVMLGSAETKRQQAFDSGATDFMAKPFSPGVLYESLSRQLSDGQ